MDFKKIDFCLSRKVLLMKINLQVQLIILIGIMSGLILDDVSSSTVVLKKDSSKTIKVNLDEYAVLKICRTADDFKEYIRQYVRQSVQDENFWRDLMLKFSINSLVEKELNSKIPDKVKKSAGKYVPDLVENRLNKFLLNDLGGHVKKELNSQFTNYLNQHIQMNEIMSIHSSELTNKLTNLSTQIIDKIAAEEQYHVLRDALLSEMREKHEMELKAVQQRVSEQLKQNKKSFDEHQQLFLFCFNCSETLC